MKRYSHLYTQITDINNIRKAILKASCKKRNRKSVQKILNNIDKYAYRLQDMLINHTFVPSPYEVQKIYDGARKKERIIKKPKFFPDQCVHWCLMLVVKDLFKKRFYQWSCSSIEGRGTFYAKDYLKCALKDTRNTKYCYQIDIKKFYPSIDNEILKSKLRRMFKDEEVLWLFDTIIDSDKGLPIGNYTSQWLANFYLTDLDMYIKQDLHVRYYCRYADDMIIFSSSKRKLQRDRRLIEEYIHKEKLEIKSSWKLFKSDSRPIDYLGFKLYRDRITLRSSLCLRLQRRSTKIGKKEEINLKDACSITAYWGYIKHTDSHNFYYYKIRINTDINKCKEIISYEAKKQFENHIQIQC